MESEDSDFTKVKIGCSPGVIPSGRPLSEISLRTGCCSEEDVQDRSAVREVEDGNSSDVETRFLPGELPSNSPPSTISSPVEVCCEKEDGSNCVSNGEIEDGDRATKTVCKVLCTVVDCREQSGRGDCRSGTPDDKFRRCNESVNDDKVLEAVEVSVFGRDGSMVVMPPVLRTDSLARGATNVNMARVRDDEVTDASGLSHDAIVREHSS